ncbi:MAG: hypothetical protein HOO88_04045 [Kiritimatiellaceae bacterium]|nr:hypothetical protein [Kiritimatiellaceae bacterium]
MKKTLLLISLLPFTATFAEKKPAEPTPSFSQIQIIQEEKQFQSCENVGGSGFFWIDTSSADVWLFDTATETWKFLGSPRGSNDNRKGAYELLTNKAGGFYLLNTKTGEGWSWTAATSWKTIGAPSRRIKPPEDRKD